jgi:hypothetical protein
MESRHGPKNSAPLPNRPPQSVVSSHLGLVSGLQSRPFGLSTPSQVDKPSGIRRRFALLPLRGQRRTFTGFPIIRIATGQCGTKDGNTIAYSLLRLESFRDIQKTHSEYRTQS